MRLTARLLLLLAMGAATSAVAQADAPFDAPPLITVEEAAPTTTPDEATAPPEGETTQAPPGPRGVPDASGVIQPPAIANAPLSKTPTAAAGDEPPGRPLRILTGLLFGAGAGALGAVAGGFAGRATLPDTSLQPVGATWAGAAIGFAVAAPVGVLLSGRLFDGDGSALATLVGNFVGLGLGVGATLAGGQDGTPLLFALPLVGAVLGYEVTSPAARSLVKVSASVTPSREGALVGLAGVW